MAISKLIPGILLLTLLPATAYVVMASTHSQSPLPEASSVRLTSLSISVSGTATQIGNATKPLTPQHGMRPTVVAEPSVQRSSSPLSASVTISSSIVRETNGTIIFNVTGTTLKIGSPSYSIINGTGIFNQHSLVVVVHATVSVNGVTRMLILIGLADSALSSSGQVGVTFGSPQSKLAGRFFLSLTGKLTIA